MNGAIILVNRNEMCLKATLGTKESAVKVVVKQQNREGR